LNREGFFWSIVPLIVETKFLLEQVKITALWECDGCFGVVSCWGYSIQVASSIRYLHGSATWDLYTFCGWIYDSAYITKKLTLSRRQWLHLVGLRVSSHCA
jgi:hypothetical protein